MKFPDVKSRFVTLARVFPWPRDGPFVVRHTLSIQGLFPKRNEKKVNMKIRCVSWISTILLLWVVSCAQTPNGTTSGGTINVSTVSGVPTQIPPQPGKIIFADDFSNHPLGHFQNINNPNFVFGEKWSGYNEVGTYMEIVPDPLTSTDTLGKPRGNVLKITTKGAPQMLPHLGDGKYWRQGYPSWWNGSPPTTLAAPLVLQVDILKSPGLSASVIGAHRQNKLNGAVDNSFGITVWGDDEAFITEAGEVNRKIKKGLIKANQWTSVTIELDLDGKLTPWINGENGYVDPNDPLFIEVDERHEAGILDAHPGILQNSLNPSDVAREGDILYNDNFIVYTFQATSATITRVPRATPTAAPTATPRPTAILRPMQIIFQDDFDWTLTNQAG